MLTALIAAKIFRGTWMATEYPAPVLPAIALLEPLVRITVEEISDLEARDMAERAYKTPTKSTRVQRSRSGQEEMLLRLSCLRPGARSSARRLGPPHWTLCRTWRPWPGICAAPTQMLGGQAAFLGVPFQHEAEEVEHTCCLVMEDK
jgi:hypothetical protein